MSKDTLKTGFYQFLLNFLEKNNYTVDVDVNNTEVGFLHPGSSPDYFWTKP